MKKFNTLSTIVKYENILDVYEYDDDLFMIHAYSTDSKVNDQFFMEKSDFDNIPGNKFEYLTYTYDMRSKEPVEIGAEKARKLNRKKYRLYPEKAYRYLVDHSFSQLEDKFCPIFDLVGKEISRDKIINFSYEDHNIYRPGKKEPISRVYDIEFWESGFDLGALEEYLKAHPAVIKTKMKYTPGYNVDICGKRELSCLVILPQEQYDELYHSLKDDKYWSVRLKEAFESRWDGAGDALGVSKYRRESK